MSVSDPGPMERSCLQIKDVEIFLVNICKSDFSRVGGRTKVSSVDSSLIIASCWACQQQFVVNEVCCIIENRATLVEGGKGTALFF